jgi:hypothetical protein
MDSSAYGDLQKAVKEAATGLAMMVATHPYVYPWTLHPVIRAGNALGKDPIHAPFGEPEVLYPEIPSSFRKNRPRAVQAAVGREQVARMEALNGARQRNGKWLDTQLAARRGDLPGLSLPTYPEGAEPIYMSFVVHHPRRDALMSSLRKRGVDTTTGYMNDCSDHELFPQFRRPCPNAAETKREQLHLPVHPRMDERDLSHMADMLVEACREVGA